VVIRELKKPLWGEKEVPQGGGNSTPEKRTSIDAIDRFNGKRGE